jgi:hypothetical protein
MQILFIYHFEVKERKEMKCASEQPSQGNCCLRQALAKSAYLLVGCRYNGTCEGKITKRFAGIKQAICVDPDYCNQKNFEFFASISRRKR